MVLVFNLDLVGGGRMECVSARVRKCVNGQVLVEGVFMVFGIRLIRGQTRSTAS